MHLKLTFFRYLLIVVSLGVNVNGLRCYICGEDDDKPNNNNSCENFDTLKNSYVNECMPPDNKACETEMKDGKVVKRTCAKTNINQCFPANSVLYCFCTTDLCNSDITATKFFSPTDDEDLLEGSGTKTITIATENPKITHKVNSTGSVTCVSCYIIFVSFIVFTITI